MTRISRAHPRYASLRTRARLAQAAREGLVVPEGLIAHGRGEAFDYLLGERSTPSAREAARVAASWLLAARRPVLSVNGNVAALAAGPIARLVRAVPKLAVEVNLFHRSPARARQVARALRAAGVPRVLGVRPTARIPGLPSDRALVDRDGIAAADLCIVPLEDGDRAEALRRLGKRIIAIDLNPISRTARTAHLPIVDDVRRALDNVRIAVRGRRGGEPPPARRAPGRAYLTAALGEMRRRLPSRAGGARFRSPRGRRARSDRPRQ